MANSTLREISLRYGIEYATLYARLRARNIKHNRVGNVIVVSPLNIEALVRSPNEKQMSEHPLYRRWCRHRTRMCHRWKSSFATFCDDIGTAPHGAKLVAVDSRGCLAPDNYRWA